MEEEILKRLSDNAREEYLRLTETQPNAHSARFVELIIKGLLNAEPGKSCFSNDDLKYVCTSDLGTVQELFPEDARKFMEMYHPDYSLYTYYHGEYENPYREDTTQAHWWYGERLFDENRVKDDNFVDDWSNELERFLSENDNVEPAFLKDAEMPIERRALLFYLISWSMKWFPYKDITEDIKEYARVSAEEHYDNMEYLKEIESWPGMCPERPLFYESLGYGDTVRYWEHEPHSQRFLQIMMQFEDILDGTCEPKGNGFYFSDDDIEFACKEDITTFGKFFPDEVEYYEKQLK